MGNQNFSLMGNEHRRICEKLDALDFKITRFIVGAFKRLTFRDVVKHRNTRKALKRKAIDSILKGGKYENKT